MLKVRDGESIFGKYLVFENGVLLTEIDKQKFRLGKVLFVITTENFSKSRIHLLKDDQAVATALMPNLFLTQYWIEFNNEKYLLKKNIFGKKFILLFGKEKIGDVKPDGYGSTTAVIDAPFSIPLEVRIFISWIVKFTWLKQNAF